MGGFVEVGLRTDNVFINIMIHWLQIDFKDSIWLVLQPCVRYLAFELEYTWFQWNLSSCNTLQVNLQINFTVHFSPVLRSLKLGTYVICWFGVQGENPFILVLRALFIMEATRKLTARLLWLRPNHDSMDEKRTQTLCSGLLAKAPLKNKRKASLPVFWKLRWCVLSRVTYLDSPSKDTKLVFAYYKDEAHLREDSLPLGKYL